MHQLSLKDSSAFTDLPIQKDEVNLEIIADEEDIDISKTKEFSSEKKKRTEKAKMIQNFSASLTENEMIQSVAIHSRKMNGNTCKQNESTQKSKSTDYSNDFTDFFGALLTAAVCVLYFVLMYHFPVIMTIITILVVLVGIIIFINGLFDFFEDFLSLIFR